MVLVFLLIGLSVVDTMTELLHMGREMLVVIIGGFAVHITLFTAVEGLMGLFVDGPFKDKFERISVVMMVVVVLVDNVLVFIVAFMTTVFDGLFLNC